MDKIKYLTEKIKDLTVEIDIIREDLSQCSLEDFEKLNLSIGNLNERVDELGESLNVISNKFPTVESDISNIKNNISSAEQKIQSCEENITQNTSDIAQNTSNISQNTADITQNAIWDFTDRYGNPSGPTKYTGDEFSGGLASKETRTVYIQFKLYNKNH